MNQHSKKQCESLFQHIDHFEDQQSEEHIAPEETHSRPTIHVYLTDEPAELEEEAKTIESTIEHITDGVHPTETKTFPGAPYSPRMSKRTVFITVILVCLLMMGGSVLWSLMARWTPQVMITLVPVTTEISMTSSVILTTTAMGTATENHVPGRLLPSLTLSQQQTTHTTGTGHQEARAAHGAIIFYNASLSSQTISTGMVLIGADGVHVVTDQEVVIPAGTG